MRVRPLADIHMLSYLVIKFIVKLIKPYKLVFPPTWAKLINNYEAH